MVKRVISPQASCDVYVGCFIVTHLDNVTRNVCMLSACLILLVCWGYSVRW